MIWMPQFANLGTTLTLIHGLVNISLVGSTNVSMGNSKNVSMGNSMAEDTKLEIEKKICVTSCGFSFEQKSMDNVMNVTEWSGDDRLKFYFFSNLDFIQSDLGWENLIFFEPKYRRMITQSRWPKFMSWNHPIIDKNCKTVFYLDGSARPTSTDFVSFLIDLSTTVLNSQEKFVVAPHPKSRSITQEFKAILRSRKDITKNVDASMAWLKEQSDFKDETAIYRLTYFMFATHSVHWRNLTSFFWSHYSEEVDSWRDQPLFAYSMHHLNYSASVSLKNNLVRNGHMGHNGHRYSAEDDVMVSRVVPPPNMPGN